MRFAIGLSRVGSAAGAALAWPVLAITAASRGEALGPAAKSDSFAWSSEAQELYETILASE